MVCVLHAPVILHDIDCKGVVVMSIWTLLSELKCGIRRLAKQPSFAAAGAVTLAVGIGANAAIFALQMLLETPGRTYSFAEISAWLEAAGFHEMVEVPVEAPMSISLVLSLKPGKRALAVLPKPAAKLEQASAEESVSAKESDLEKVPSVAGTPASPRLKTARPRTASAPRSSGKAAPAKKESGESKITAKKVNSKAPSSKSSSRAASVSEKPKR